MAKKDFSEAAKAATSNGAEPEGALRVLGEFCEGVQDGTDGRVQCWLERSWATYLGQQWHVMFAAEGRAYPSVMLKAYVPPAGTPVYLDIYDEDPVECADLDTLNAELLAFLRHDVVQDNLRLLQQQAPPPRAASPH